tara:strand:- start:665 stop:1279 length:615 start_codon:yes stop_codon:yes gene_type:complete
MIKQINNLIIGFTLIALGLISCESEKKLTRQDMVKNSVEEYLKSKMNDPASYEFVDLKLIDSVSYLDNVNYRIEDFEGDIKYEMNMIAAIAPYEKELPKIWEESKKAQTEELKTEIERSEKIISEIERLKLELGEKVNDIASYTYLYSFRGNNKMGAKVLNEYILQTDPAPNFGILNLAENEDKVTLNPNDFPGYKEMITKYFN